jgi:hypothetical protein
MLSWRPALYRVMSRCFSTSISSSVVQGRLARRVVHERLSDAAEKMIFFGIAAPQQTVAYGEIFDRAITGGRVPFTELATLAAKCHLTDARRLALLMHCPDLSRAKVLFADWQAARQPHTLPITAFNRMMELALEHGSDVAADAPPTETTTGTSTGVPPLLLLAPFRFSPTVAPWLAAAQQQQVPLDEVSFVLLMRDRVSQREGAHAEELLRYALSPDSGVGFGVQSVHTFLPVLQWHATRGDVVRFDALLDVMQARNMPVTSDVGLQQVLCLLRASHLDAAFATVRRLRVHGVPRSGYMYRSWLRALAFHSESSSAAYLRLLALMREDGFVVTSTAYTWLLHVFHRESISPTELMERALSIFQVRVSVCECVCVYVCMYVCDRGTGRVS